MTYVNVPGVAAAVVLLVSSSATGYQLMKNPVRIAERVEKRGWYIPFLEHTKTKRGLFKVRLSGLLLMLASAYMLFGILAALAASRKG